MTKEEFLNVHENRLQKFVAKQKNDISDNTPNKLENFNRRVEYLGQQIIDKSDLLISEIFIEYNLDSTLTVNTGGTIVNILRQLLLGVSNANIKHTRDFDSHANDIRISKFYSY